MFELCQICKERNNCLCFNFLYIQMTSHPDHIFNVLCVYEGRLEIKFINVNISGFFNTLRTGDADLRFYITTVQDG